MAPPKDTSTLGRRDFLAKSACGMGAVAVQSLLCQDGVLGAGSPFAPKPAHMAAPARACIFLNMGGGSSQMDLFDPKPVLAKRHGEPLPPSFYSDKTLFSNLEPKDAILLGCPWGFKKHGECGMEMSNLLPHLSDCVDDLAQIRSVHTDEFNHQQAAVMLFTGKGSPGRPSMGSWVSYGLGCESQELPAYVSLGGRPSGGDTALSSGILPTAHNATLFREKGSPIVSLRTPDGISPNQQRQTVDAIHDMNRRHHELIGDPEILTRIAAYELAFRMQISAPELLDLSDESPETLSLYGVDRSEAPYLESEDISGFEKGRFSRVAAQLVMARRLVERGVRFVVVNVGGWDHHNVMNKVTPFYCSIVDQPVAALIKDLKQRGMLDETLVVWGTEFGRTPVGENSGMSKAAHLKNTGRDHHPFAFTMWMAGGGVQGGTIVGRTDEIGWLPVEDPVHMNDFHATMLHLLGLDHKRLSLRSQGLDVRLTDVGGHVVKKLLKRA